MNQLEAAPLGGAPPAPATPAPATPPGANDGPPPPAADPFAGMDLPQFSEEEDEPEGAAPTTAPPPELEEPEESDFAGRAIQPEPEPERERESEPISEAKAEPEPEPIPEAKAEPEPEPEPIPQQRIRKPKSQPGSEPKASAETKKLHRVIKTAPSETNQLELRAIFGVDRDLSHPEILRQARSLPGIKNVTSVDAGDLDALESLQDAVSKWGFGENIEIDISCGNGVVDFITEGETCLAVLISGAYGPGVRETLIIVARTLERM